MAGEEKEDSVIRAGLTGQLVGDDAQDILFSCLSVIQLEDFPDSKPRSSNFDRTLLASLTA
jgi:hypothetical protein